VGRRAAGLVFSSRPGEWSLVYDLANPEAAGFWPAVVAAVAECAPVRRAVGPPDRRAPGFELRFTTR